jgi:HEAT repeat protein
VTRCHRFKRQSSSCEILSPVLPLGAYLLTIILLWFAGCSQEAPIRPAERAVVLLTPLLHDENPEIRRTAAESLGKIGDQTTAVSILPLLGDPDPTVRTAAARALGRMASPPTQEVVDALTRALQDPIDSVKQAASMAIGDIEPVSHQLRLAVSLVSAPDTEVRRAAVQTLRQVDASPWLSVLVSALRDSDAEVRQSAVAALGESGGPNMAIEIRNRLTDDSSPAVRAEAAYQLGNVGGRDAKLALEQAVAKDPESGVRRWAEAELRSLRVTD